MSILLDSSQLHDSDEIRVYTLYSYSFKNDDDDDLVVTSLSTLVESYQDIWNEANALCNEALYSHELNLGHCDTVKSAKQPDTYHIQPNYRTCSYKHTV